MKYYKITNESENHGGMQYQTGLNEDILPFNPSGDCESGGIYFTDADNILSFGMRGKWIREVTIPEGEPVYKNLGKPLKWKAYRVILGERRDFQKEICGIISEFTNGTMEVKGNLNLAECSEIEMLPDGLKVNGWLDIRYGKKLRSLPEDLSIGRWCVLCGCEELTEIPRGFSVGSDLFLGRLC